jgi:hypothetical protein
MTSFEDSHNKSSKIMQFFTKEAFNYKRGSFDYKKNFNLVIDMLLNTMKIEGQEVDRAEFLKSLDEPNPS